MIKVVVGVRGLEPPTSASRTLRASQLRHTPAEGKSLIITAGATEDKNLEPLHSIADWLINNPEPDWLEQLSQATTTPYVQAFNYWGHEHL